MKRSEINRAIYMAKEILEKHSFHLPSFAHMKPEDWKNVGPEYKRIIQNKLGWDISDFGGNDFDNFGTVQFTLRNGRYDNIEEGTPYAEKYIILKPGQRLPLHFHYFKTEDIINRGGGILSIKLYNSLKNNEVDRNSEVIVYCDGIQKRLDPGQVLNIRPGDSITLTPRLYHLFWADKKSETLICGEVSTVNDDVEDNYFAEEVRRFAKIDEDEEKYRPLCNEYEED